MRQSLLYVTGRHCGIHTDQISLFADASRAAPRRGKATVAVHWEVYRGAVRDLRDWKPLLWEPGRPVVDLDKLVPLNGSEPSL